MKDLQFQFLAILALLFFPLEGMHAQGYQIDGHLENYSEDTIFLGYYYGDKQYLIDTTRVEEGKFRFEGNDSLRSGVYLVVMPPENTFFQILVDGSEARFSFSADHDNLNSTISFVGSLDNELFYENMNYISQKKKEAERLTTEISSATAPLAKAAAQKKMDELGSVVIAHQKTLIDKAPGSLSGALIGSGIGADVPEFEGTPEEVQLKRYTYFKKHYFDNLDLGDQRMLLTPQNIMFDRVVYYLEKLTPQHPDSISASLDRMLGMMEPAPETYKFFLVKFLNDYASPKYVGHDAVFVHLSDTYYATGKAPWVEEKQLNKILDEAKKTKPTLIGKVSPDFTVQLADSSDITLHEIESDYLILVFWAHDCGHCEESMPALAKYYREHPDLDLKVLSVCTKLNADEPPCWDFVDEKNLDGLINASDKRGGRSYVHSLYHIKKTPKLFILDRDKNILTKGIGVEHLDEFFKSQGVSVSE